MSPKSERHWPVTLLWLDLGWSRHKFRLPEDAARYAQDKGLPASWWDGGRLLGTYDPHRADPVRRYS